MAYAFEANLEFTSRDSEDDIIPVIMCWIFENIGPYDKKRWQIRTHMGDKTFLSVNFANSTDATAFKLAWV